MQQFITGIQQIGIGVADAEAAKYLYRDLLGMNVLVFDDVAKADLMSKYTGDTVFERRAILALNMQGGGGVEIWQFTNRKPGYVASPSVLGDIGIFAAKIKTTDIHKAHAAFAKITLNNTSSLFISPENKKHFWIRDAYGNWFNIIESKDYFNKTKSLCGGVKGAVIGVTDMKKAMEFYINILGISEILYDVTGPIKDGPEDNERGTGYRRVLLKKNVATIGAF